MTNTSVNKIDVARRHINAAIRMTFSGEDPIAIRCLISAANQIVRDLCKRSGTIESFVRFTDWIKPGCEKQFWKHFNRPGNFLKHADHDPDDIYEFNELDADFLLIVTIRWFVDLGNSSSAEMNIFGVWWACQNKDVIKPGLMTMFDDIAPGVMGKLVDYFDQCTEREELLKAGRLMLSQQGTSLRAPSA